MRVRSMDKNSKLNAIDINAESDVESDEEGTTKVELALNKIINNQNKKIDNLENQNVKLRDKIENKENRIAALLGSTNRLLKERNNLKKENEDSKQKIRELIIIIDDCRMLLRLKRSKTS